MRLVDGDRYTLAGGDETIRGAAFEIEKCCKTTGALRRYICVRYKYISILCLTRRNYVTWALRNKKKTC